MKIRKKDIKLTTVLFIVILGIFYVWDGIKVAKENKLLNDKNATIHAKLYDALSTVKKLEKNNKNDSNFEIVHWNKVSILKHNYKYAILDSDIIVDSALKNEISKYFDEEPTIEKLAKRFEEITGVKPTIIYE